MTASATLNPIPLLRGDSGVCQSWITESLGRRAIACVAVICLGCGLYGAAIGSWRAPEMGLYVAVKFPVLILATLLVNGLINGMFAQILGSGLSFGQSLQSQLLGFMIFALLLGSLSPVAFAMALGAPEVGSDQEYASNRTQLLVHIAIIIYAGVLSHRKLYQMLLSQTQSRLIALQTLFAWLAGNLFVGAQLSWNLRPFFGSPYLEVEFLREDALDGTFYEAVLTLLQNTL